jgi:inosine-uridine nucleoside N-ribohydrolase
MNKPSAADAHKVRTTDGVGALTDNSEDQRLDWSSVQGLRCVRQLRFMQLCVYLLASLFLFSLARADEPELVIVDNDFTGPPATLSDLRSALMFLQNPNVKVLGFTVVTGNGWRDEEVAHLLRLEEIVSRCDVPVVPGAITPLVNTPKDTLAWETRYHNRRYKGAWDAKGDRGWEPDYIPHAENVVPPIPEGLPCIRASEELAPEFMIRQVHAHPHEVCILLAVPSQM